MSEGATAEITVMRRSVWQVSPDAVFFEVTVDGFDAVAPTAGQIYDSRFHDLYYFWDFDDPYDFQAPENLPSKHLNAGVAYGPWVSHTFRTPGSYRVSVFVIEPASGKTATASTDIVIEDPGAVFPARNTLFLSPSGNFEHSPPRARRLKTGDISSVFNDNIAGQEAAPKRIVLNRGEEYTFSGISPGFGGHTPSFHIVAGDGNADRPLVFCTGGVFWNDIAPRIPNPSKDMVWQNVVLESGFDSTSVLGGEHPILFTWFNNPPHLALLDGCSVSGLLAAIIVGQTEGGHSVVLNDTVVTNFGTAVLDASFEGFAITGSSIISDVNALIDSTGNGGWGARLAGNAVVSIIQNSDFFIRQGWSGNGKIIATQPCLRLNASSFEGAKINCQANAFEGGYNVVTMGPGEGQKKRPINALFEKNYVVGGYQTANLVNFGFGGTTIRNNVFVLPDSEQSLGTTNPHAFILLDGHNGGSSTSPDNNSAPISILNNTFVNRLRRDAYQWDVADNMAIFVNWQDHFNNITVANNVVYQTGTDDPMIGDAPLSSSVNVFFTPRERGYQSSTVDLRAQTATLNTPGMFDTYAPLPGSSALGDADETQPIAYDDFFGNQRPQYPSRGAQEAS
ncbi:PKD domain-containing protein (plasmid) [Ruegeria sp. SCSIO 43209]|uniref:PKD domain-containing protein n=1 Tax=Ruegeria sp. SCSIO 43209 TaxID=2793010 RepID=UPI001CA881C5|nr:PKD domain-containing protein [Ruegeria sp. SCSIO 43209]UAB91734.1 PKD domain-containing protein [Ruegeria sp. SCSIO 43209]